MILQQRLVELICTRYNRRGIVLLWGPQQAQIAQHATWSTVRRQGC